MAWHGAFVWPRAWREECLAAPNLVPSGQDGEGDADKTRLEPERRLLGRHDAERRHPPLAKPHLRAHPRTEICGEKIRARPRGMNAGVRARRSKQRIHAGKTICALFFLAHDRGNLGPTGWCAPPASTVMDKPTPHRIFTVERGQI